MSLLNSDNFALKLAHFVIRFRWLIVVLSFAIVAVLGAGITKMSAQNDYRVFFSKENPELENFERFQDTYAKTDSVLVVIRNPQGPVLSPKVASDIEWLTEEAWKVPFASRVDSITNYQHTWSEEDELVVENLIEDADTLSDDDIRKKEADALSDPLLRGNLISLDKKTVAASITFNLPTDDADAVPQAIQATRDLMAEFKKRNPELELALSGTVALNNAFVEASKADIKGLIPIMYVFLIVMTLLVIRSFFGSISTLMIIALSTIAAMGSAGHLGIPLTPVSAGAPIIIMTLAIADSIHVLVSMLGLYRAGSDKNEAIVESLRLNFVPVTMTSLTTLIGFLTLNFSDAPPYWHLGNTTAAGIITAWILSLTLLPALLSILPLKRPKENEADWPKQKMGEFADWVIARRKSILVIGGLTTIILTAAAPTLELNDEFIKYFSKNIQFRVDADYTSEHLTGVYVVEYSVPSTGEQAINEPEYMNSLEAFAQWLRKQPEVRHVYSYTDIIKRLNYNMHGDDPEWIRIPQDRELAAQYLFLYEMSLPFGLELTNRVSFDKSETRLTLMVDNISSVEMRALHERVDTWMKENMPEYMHTRPTGTATMFTYISKRNVESMMEGNVIAVVIISTIMLILLRSLSLGFVSLLANGLPIIMMFGVWAILVGKVGMVASTVAAGTLGIVVDDTVHFLTKYLRATREMGYSRAKAIRYTFETVGVAIVSTTIILVIGFGVLVLSDFQLNQQTGLMSGITIVLALLFDLFVLPAILLFNEKADATKS